MDPRLVSNLTDVTQVDGVYIYESAPPGYVRGVGTSIVGIIGEFERGPCDQVLNIGSTAEFLKTLGGYGAVPSGEEDTWRGYSGFRALSGKYWPAGLRVVRVSRTAMAKATVNIPLDGYTLTATAKHKGAYGNAIDVTIDDASDASLTKGFKLHISCGDEAETIDNLSAGMTVTALAAATANLTLVDLALAVDAESEAAEWPESYDLATGSDGTALLSSWTDAVDKLLATREVNILFYAEPDGTTVTFAALNAYIKSVVAPSAGTTPFTLAVLAGAADQSSSEAGIDTDAYRNERIIYAWPWRRQHYSDASPLHADGELLIPSNDIVSSALANIDPVYDPASSIGGRFVNAATTGLEFDDLNRDDYVTAASKGICALEFDPDLGYRIVTGITTDLTPGKEMIHRRRLADYLTRSVAMFLKFYQNQPITQDWKDEVEGAIAGFLETEKNLKPVPRVLEYEVDTESVNTPTTEGQGIFNILMKVRVPASARYIVLLSQIGTTVEIVRREDLE